MRPPGVAPGLPPWQGGILLFRSQPRKVKGPGASRLPAHAISTKNKHLLVIYSIPTRGFTAAVSVFSPSTPRVARRSGLTLSLSKGFRGTPPAKPLICKFKIRLVRPGDAVFRSWADPTGEASLLVLAKFILSPEDITWMSLCSCSQIVRLSSLLVHIHVVQGK